MLRKNPLAKKVCFQRCPFNLHINLSLLRFQENWKQFLVNDMSPYSLDKKNYEVYYLHISMIHNISENFLHGF